MKKSACFVLTRGYSFRQKHKYLLLIVRNWAARRILNREFEVLDFLIFHEGNISRFDQHMIRILSFNLRIVFVDISEIFSIPRDFVWTGNSKYSLGYSLMCRFNYLQVWQFLGDYEWVIRVDEDCILKSIPKIDSLGNFTVGAIARESHEPTNSTLPTFLESLDVGHLYDQKFPYTNVYITKPKHWLQPDVQDFLEKVGSESVCLEYRWGDLPILGVTAKKFLNWDWKEGFSKDLVYWHRSHRHMVLGDNQILDF